MKRFEGDRFNTMAIKGHNRLDVKGDTLESTRDEIDRANKRAIERGYKAEQWIITHQEWYRFFDNDGNFVKSEEYEQAIEIYPTSI